MLRTEEMIELAPGTIVSERYRLERRVGEGGMGEVWAATHTITRKSVALKVLKADVAQRPEVVKRFMREARAATAVRHPHVVQVHDVIEHQSMPVMVMDLLSGQSLADYLMREERLSLEETSAILSPVMEAIVMAHERGIVHRDLKPENIFLAVGHGGQVQPKVLDFGIAKLSAVEGDAAQTAALTRTGSMMGTPYYMAPEQAYGERDVDKRVDVWAMGVILYECLGGQRPFDGDNFGQVFKSIVNHNPSPLDELEPRIPAEVANLVESMLRRDRAERLSSLELALATLAPWSKGDIPLATAPFLTLPTDVTLDTVEASALSKPATVDDQVTSEPTLYVGPQPSPDITAAETLLAAQSAPERSRVVASHGSRSWLGAGLIASAVLAVMATGVYWSRAGSVEPTSSVSMNVTASGEVEPPSAAIATARSTTTSLASSTPMASVSTPAPAELPSSKPPSKLPVAARWAPKKGASAPRVTSAAVAPAPKPPEKLPGGILNKDDAPF